MKGFYIIWKILNNFFFIFYFEKKNEILSMFNILFSSFFFFFCNFIYFKKIWNIFYSFEFFLSLFSWWNLSSLPLNHYFLITIMPPPQKLIITTFPHKKCNRSRLQFLIYTTQRIADIEIISSGHILTISPKTYLD